MSLTCPKCHKTLYARDLNGVEVDYCEEGCKGIWFDEGELQKVRQSEKSGIYAEQTGSFKEKSKDDSIKEADRTCPKCGESAKLNRYNWDLKSDIFLDTCPQCKGVWLDFGELEGMSKYLEGSSNKSEQEMEVLKEKLALIRAETMDKFEEDKDENARKVVDWDIWLFDDAIRYIMKKLT